MPYASLAGVRHVLLPVLPCLPQEGCSEPVGRWERWGGWDGVAEAQVPCPCALITGGLCCSLGLTSSQRHSLEQCGGLPGSCSRRGQGTRTVPSRVGGKRRVGCKRQGCSPTMGSRSLGPEDPGNKGVKTHQNSCPGPLQAQILHPLSCLLLVGLS